MAPRWTRRWEAGSSLARVAVRPQLQRGPPWHRSEAAMAPRWPRRSEPASSLARVAFHVAWPQQLRGSTRPSACRHRWAIRVARLQTPSPKCSSRPMLTPLAWQCAAGGPAWFGFGLLRCHQRVKICGARCPPLVRGKHSSAWTSVAGCCGCTGGAQTGGQLHRSASRTAVLLLHARTGGTRRCAWTSLICRTGWDGGHALRSAWTRARGVTLLS